MGRPFGKYELLKRIAGGGMGEVYLARQAGLEGFEKLLVVKVLLPHLVEDEEFIRMFLDEARIAARLNHPNVAQIFELGQEEGTWYLAMEWIHGEDIVRTWKQARNASKTVPFALTARIIADAAAGLDYAHKITDSNGQPLGLVHRDVSPQNILVTFEGAVKVIDFGVAKAAGRASHTATGMLKGKYAYMSPEQASGKPVDRRSDVFALGVVLYEMATSLRLFKRDNEVSTLHAVAACEIQPPIEQNPNIDPGLNEIIMKALARDPEQRYQDAMQLRLALEDWISQTRSPASNAHLGAFMQELFAERLAAERAAGSSAFQGELSPTSGPRSRSMPGLTTPGRPGVLDRTPSGTSMPGVPTPSNTAWKAPVIVLGSVLLIGGGIAAAFWPKSKPSEAPVVPVPVAYMNVSSQPAGATVTVNGKVAGVTPLEGTKLESGQYAQVVVTLDGYKPVTKQVAGMGNQSLDVTLVKDVPEQPVIAPKPVEVAKQEVELRFESTPAGATVLVGEKDVGRTPLVLKQTKSDEALQVSMKLAGYRPFTKTVSPNGDTEVKATLARIAVSHKSADPLEIKTGR